MPITRVVDSEDEESDSNARNIAAAEAATGADDGGEAGTSLTATQPPRKRIRFTHTSGTHEHAGRVNGAPTAATPDDEDVVMEDEVENEEDEEQDDGEFEGGKSSKNGGRTKLSWEEEYSRSWDLVTEDDHGSLEGAVAAFLTSSKRRRVLRDTTAIQRGIIRHLFVVIDLSESMTDRDMRPSRLELTLKYAQEFVAEFFDQNPISQLAIVGTRDGMAERISHLGGNPVEHVKALQNKRKLLPSGEPSLQNALNMCRSGLSHLPTHGSREVVVIFGSLTTCDPGNIHETLDALVKDRIRVNVIGLSAEMSICREIAKKTRGTFSVCLNEDHFKDLLFETVLPPASLKPKNAALAAAGVPGTTRTGNSAANTVDLMIMGFPTLLPQSQFPTLCSCHSKLYKSKGYTCPRCYSKLCEVPTECGVCRLTIVSSPHLARSYRHLFPVGNWVEVNGPLKDMPSTCFACSIRFPPAADSSGPTPIANTTGQATGTTAGTTISGGMNVTTNVAGSVSTTGRYQCPNCKNQFCIDCDIFVHQLGACPGCM